MTPAVQERPRGAPRPQLWRVTERESFQDLRRGGRRVRRGSLAVTFLAPDPSSPPTPPRVAFAIGTTVGGAVVRNRIRRRVRAALRGLLVVDRLPAGTYLIGATTETAQMPWSKLVATLSTTIDEVTR